MPFRYSGSGWRVAPSIKTFGDQIMAARGSTASLPTDGTLGDTAHSNRVSDHNPDPQGIVRALDFHEHTPGFVDAVGEALRARKDPRLKYFIHDDRLFSSYATSSRKAWEWGPYTGINGHENHGHLSVVSTAIANNTDPWLAPGGPNPGGRKRYVAIPEHRRLLIRHAHAQGWIQGDLNYWLANLPEWQKASSSMPTG